MATDIAFALGVVALLGPRIPSPVRLFLLTLAVVDDIGAIVVIAVWYSGTIELGWLAAATAIAIVIGLAHRRGFHAVPLHVVLGVALWYCTFRSGVHATIAGVVAGLLATAGGPRPVAERWEHAIAPLVGYVIVPAFAFVNAGVRIEPDVLGRRGPLLVGVGTVVGLVVGKVVGVVGASWVVVRFTPTRLPEGTGWRHLLGVGALAGMGFTVSLFVANLAFDVASLESAAKVGVLAATAIAAVSGAAVLGTVDARAGARRTGQDVR
jgi:NhaA family Na+:H+ antiporter